MPDDTSVSSCGSVVLHSPTVADPHLRLTVSSRSGSVRVDARLGAELSVKGGTVHHASDGSLRVDPSSWSSSITLSCPAGTDVSVGTVSGRVILTGDLGSVRVATVSGTVDVEHAATIDARSNSAGIDIERCDSDCRAVSVSGRIRVQHAASADITTHSGAIRVTAVDAADLRSVNGSVKVWTAGRTQIRARTLSAGVTVVVPRGMKPASRLSSFSGSIRNPIGVGTDGLIEVRTESGSIQVVER